MSPGRPPRTAEAAAQPLKLRAADETDLAVLAACLQDAIVATRDLRFLPEERRFALLASRYRWERDRGEAKREAGGERVLSALVFEGVGAVQRTRLDPKERDRYLELLTIAAEGAPATDGGRVILLTFAGGAAVRLTADRIDCRIEDLAEPWPTLWRPRHD